MEILFFLIAHPPTAVQAKSRNPQTLEDAERRSFSTTEGEFSPLKLHLKRHPSLTGGRAAPTHCGGGIFYFLFFLFTTLCRTICHASFEPHLHTEALIESHLSLCSSSVSSLFFFFFAVVAVQHTPANEYQSALCVFQTMTSGNILDL